jgi:protein SCO1/2
MTLISRIVITFSAAATALVIVLYWPGNDGPGPLSPSVVPGRASIGGPFALIDDRGTPVTDKDFAGRPMLVAFGYTSCPDVCQMMLRNVSEALDQMGDRASEIQPLFISFDPGRDTVEVLAEHLSNFHPAIRGLTGTREAVAAAAAAYNVYYEIVPGAEPNDYLINHSSYIYLMDRQGRYAAHFSHHAAPEDMARTVLEILGG